MGNFITNLMANNIAMTIWLIGGLVMTLMAYIAPDFTRDYMVQEEVFTPGFFFGTFTHMSFAHYFGNLIVFVPASILVGMWYGQVTVLIVAVAATVVTGVIALISHSALCGMSGIGCTLAGMACLYGVNIFGIGFLVILLGVEIMTIIKGDGTAHLVHILGYIAGGVVGYLIQGL